MRGWWKLTSTPMSPSCGTSAPSLGDECHHALWSCLNLGLQLPSSINSRFQGAFSVVGPQPSKAIHLPPVSVLRKQSLSGVPLPGNRNSVRLRRSPELAVFMTPPHETQLSKHHPLRTALLISQGCSLQTLPPCTSGSSHEGSPESRCEATRG